MKLIITEKPSVAQDFAKALGNGTKQDGYIDCGEYKITWAFGHLLKVDDSEFNNGAWSLDQLPLLPKKFPFAPIPEKKKQLNTISGLLKECTSFIIATDAGREGELIAREILIYAKASTSNGFRFWSSEALTPSVVQMGMKNLKPLSEFDSLFLAAFARQTSDWIVGVNFTRFFTIKGNEIWSVGRVQTPTLALIVNRTNEIKSFVPQKYFSVSALLSTNNVTFKAVAKNSDNKEFPERLSEELADRIVSSLSPPSNKVTCIDITKETISKLPPQIHSLTSLQRAANRKHGYTAQETLDIAQSLYETHKCISYPRSDSNHIAESSFLLASEKLSFFSNGLDTDINRPGKRVFDTSKLTDHHAIIPLSKYSGTDTKEANIFSLVLNAFLASFMKPFAFDQTKYTFSTPIQSIVLISYGRAIVELGWKAVYTAQEEDSQDDSENTLPIIATGNIISVSECSKNLKHTEPPKYLNDDTILGLMERHNLGTPATRASILDRLFKVSYVSREKKNMVATEKGTELIKLLLVSNCPLSNVEMTSNWENQLEEIYKKNTRELGYNAFVNTISTFTTDQINSLKAANITIASPRLATPKMLALAKKIATDKGITAFDKKNTNYDYISNFISSYINAESTLKCPCKNGSLEDDKFYYFCNACKIKIPKQYCEKKISPKNAIDLLAHKKVFLKGFKSRNGKTFDANIYIDETQKLKFQF